MSARQAPKSESVAIRDVAGARDGCEPCHGTSSACLRAWEWLNWLHVTYHICAGHDQGLMIGIACGRRGGKLPLWRRSTACSHFLASTSKTLRISDVLQRWIFHPTTVRPFGPEVERPPDQCKWLTRKGLAGPTRLELATSGVTGRRSNQLNYDPAVVSGAEARPQASEGVGGTGFEPVTAGV